MQTASARIEHARISPSKVRIVIDLIRNKPVSEALGILHNTPKKASELVIKLLNSAVANAEHNYRMNPDNLFVSEVFANDGVTMKRYRPRAKGSAYPILKRTSHITVSVAEKQA